MTGNDFINDWEAPPRHTGQIKLHGPEAFEGMRRAGRMAAECLDMLAPHVKPGVTTGALDDLAREFLLERGGVPACIFYKGYRNTVCTSVNHVVCHGIPGPKPLKEGDIVNIDVTVIVDGWHGDTSRMYSVGEVRRKALRLMDVTYEAMMKGIELIKPGLRLADLGGAIQEHAERHRYSVVEAFCGHGLGRVFHDPPNILHFRDRKQEEIRLRAGMLFTVEPMINLGRVDVSLLPDGWTAVTRDRSLSSQYEHSVGVTETGVEIFTLSPAGLHAPHVSGASGS